MNCLLVLRAMLARVGVWHVTVVFHHLQEVGELERRLKESKQDEEKKKIEGQLKKAIARRDLARAEEVLTSLSINMYTDIIELLTFTVYSYVSVTVVPYVPLPLLRYDRATGVCTSAQM